MVESSDYTKKDFNRSDLLKTMKRKRDVTMLMMSPCLSQENVVCVSKKSALGNLKKMMTRRREERLHTIRGKLELPKRLWISVTWRWKMRLGNIGPLLVVGY